MWTNFELLNLDTQFSNLLYLPGLPVPYPYLVRVCQVPGIIYSTSITFTRPL